MSDSDWQGTLWDQQIDREPPSFGSSYVCQVTGLSYRQLDYWARSGLLTPSITQSSGMGSKRRYSRNDLVALKVMKALVDAGLSLKAASDTVAKIRETSEETLASSLLVHNGDSVKLITAKLVDLIDLWTLLNRSESVVHVLPLAHLIADIDAAPPGHKGGRNLKMTPELIDKAQRMYDSHNFTMPEIAQSCRVAPTTIYNYIKTCQPPQKGLT